MEIPKKIHLGCGRWFWEDHINIDIEARHNPDILYDLNKPLPESEDQTFESKRFGKFKISKGTFERLEANDVLEHLRDLTTFMKSCLDLLKEGGEFKLQVPYDLSYGAWQDPTHVRAFNERTWLYFTGWYYMLGWKDARFNLEKLDYSMSPLGIEMQNGGRTVDEIVRTPRAIDSMHVTLKKYRITPEETKALADYLSKKPDDK